MTRKVFKAGNSMVVSLPRDALEVLGVSEGGEVRLEIDSENARVMLSPAGYRASGVDEAFAKQVNEFIEEYRPALEKLAEGE